MMKERIIIDFERITKYPLRDFMLRYAEFSSKSYPALDDYFSGNVKTVNSEHIESYRRLSEDCKDIMSQFKNFQNKLNNCGFWELLDFISELKEGIDRIDKMPKYKRTILSKHGYGRYVDTYGNVGGGKTLEDLSSSLYKYGTNVSWDELMRANDLSEKDWEIDELKPIPSYMREERSEVSTVIDVPVGDRVYGRDVKRSLNFTDNDLEITSGEDNVLQKLDILLTINQGDIPEYPLFGRNPFLLGKNVRQSAFNEIIRNTQETILQNDLFEDVFVENIDLNEENGGFGISLTIKTKYQFSVVKNLDI